MENHNQGLTLRERYDKITLLDGLGSAEKSARSAEIMELLLSVYGTDSSQVDESELEELFAVKAALAESFGFDLTTMYNVSEMTQ